MKPRTGRPTGLAQRDRQRELIRRLTAGESWKQAAKAVGMKGDTVLTMLDEPEFQAVAAALLEGRTQIAAVTVAPEAHAA